MNGAAENQWMLVCSCWLLSGLVLVVILRFFPIRALVFVSRRFLWFSPNFISVVRLPFVYLGYILYFCHYPLWGFRLVVFGMMLDYMDGKLASALDKLNDPAIPGTTAIGKWLDPLIDKLSFIPILFIFAYKGLLVWWLAVAIIMFDIVGTFMRPPFNFIKQHVRTSQATGFGKMKSLSQWITVVVCIPYDRMWVESLLWIPQIPLTIATLLGALSVVSRLRINRDVDDVTNRVTSIFRHD